MTIKTNTIAEYTSGEGVTIDGLLIKDGGIPQAVVTAHQGAVDHGSVAGLSDDDHVQYLLATGGRVGSSAAAQDFGATGIKANVIAESSAAAGVTIDGVLLKDGLVDGRDVSAMELWTVSQKTADYTLALIDAHTIIENMAASGIIFTVPTNAAVAYPVGTRIEFRTSGGPLHFAAAGGVTINSAASYRSVTTVFAAASLTKTAENTWWLTGTLVAGYYIRDEFTTALAAGAVDGTAMEPGPGVRHLIDTAGTNLFISGGEMVINAGTGTNNQAGWWTTPGITRAAGLVIRMGFKNVASAAATGKFGPMVSGTAGFDSFNSTGMMITTGPQFTARNTATASSAILNIVATVGAEFTLYFVHRLSGRFVFIQQGSGDIKLAWFDEWSNAATLYAGMMSQNASDKLNCSHVRVPDLFFTVLANASDSFNRADGAIGSTDGAGHTEANAGSGLAWTNNVGVYTIASNAAVSSTIDTVAIATIDAVANNIFRVNTTRNGGNVGVVARYVDASNYIYAYYDGTNIALRKVVAGSDSQVAAPVAKTYAAGAKLMIKVDGSAVSVWYNELFALTGTVEDGALASAAKYGLYSTDSGNTFDNAVSFPVANYASLGDY